MLVWCTGYIAGPIAVDAIGPFSSLAYRFAIAALVAGVLAWRRYGLPAVWTGVGRHAVVGLLLNAVQFGLMYVAFDAGLPPTLAALFHSLSPVITVLLAGLLLHERVRPIQVAGFVVGVAGVVVVLGPEVEEAGGPGGVLLGSLAALALALGWLGQRWTGPELPAEWSATVQFAVSVPPTLALGLLLEDADPGHLARGGVGAVPRRRELGDRPAAHRRAGAHQRRGGVVERALPEPTGDGGPRLPGLRRRARPARGHRAGDRRRRRRRRHPLGATPGPRRTDWGLTAALGYPRPVLAREGERP